MKFELNKEQQKKLEDWRKKIKAKNGMVGLLQFRFTPNGIATEVQVYSYETKQILDLTPLPENW